MKNALPVFNIERFAIHDGDGIRTAVFLQGCPLHCPWCANPESQTVGVKRMYYENKCTGCKTCVPTCLISALTPKDGKIAVDPDICKSCGRCAEICPNDAVRMSGSPMTPEEVFEVIVRDADYYRATGGGVTLSGGEALLWIDQMLPLLAACQENSIPIAFETCGQIPIEHIKKALPYASQFLFDIKTLDKGHFKEVTGGDLEAVLANYDLIASNAPKTLITRMPVIPCFNDTEKDIRAVMAYTRDRGVTRIDLLPYHTLGVTKYAQMGREYPYWCKEAMKPEALMPYKDIGAEYGLTVRIGG